MLDTYDEPMDDAWDLAHIIVADETRATAIAAALSRSQPISLTAPPASSYTEDIRRDWHQHDHTTDPFSLNDEATRIFERLGQRVRQAILLQEWDWGDRPPSSFASWLQARLDTLRNEAPDPRPATG